MADLVSALASTDPAVCAGALQGVLRTTYATGRSSRAVLRGVLQVASSSDAPVAFRTLAFEILWALVGATDAAAHHAILAVARRDMVSADHYDLSAAALATLSAMPPSFAVDVLSTPDVERSLCDAMSGDAPAFIRCASVTTFAKVGRSLRRGVRPRAHPHIFDRAPLRTLGADRAPRVDADVRGLPRRRCVGAAEPNAADRREGPGGAAGAPGVARDRRVGVVHVSAPRFAGRRARGTPWGRRCR